MEFDKKMNDQWKVSNVVTKYRLENINGISFSVFKSAIQKFLRREEYKKGLGTLRIMSNFKDGTTDGDKLLSNIINRCVVMMSEEISINNPTLPILMKSLYERFLTSRNYNLIYVMYKALCKSTKCRLLSDLKSTFNLRPYYLKDEKALQEIHKKIISDEDAPLCRLYELDLTVEETLKKITENLQNQSYDTFVYVSYYLLKDYTAGRGGQKLWKVVIDSSNEDTVDVVNALKFFYTKMTHKEKMLYLYQAILTVIYQDELDFTPLEIDKVSLSNEFEYPLDEENKFPDYVYDIHTGNRTKGVVDFALEGALIEKEDTTFKNEKWRQNYIKFKKLLEGMDNFEKEEPKEEPKEEEPKKEPKEEPKKRKKEKRPEIVGELTIRNMFDCIRGQKLTSPSKPFVFIPTNVDKYGTMVKYVYKGPYKKQDRRGLILTWRTEILKAIDSKGPLLPRKINQKNDDWFEYKFIGNIDDVYYTEQHDNISNTDVKIIDREKSGIEQLTRMPDKQVYDIIFNSKLIFGMIDLTILGVGDMGMWNILLGYDKTAWLVDYEDTRPSEENELPLEFNILTRTSKANAVVLKRGINNNKNAIIDHLNKRKEVDWSQWDDYFQYIGNRNPNRTIDYLLEKL